MSIDSVRIEGLEALFEAYVPGEDEAVE